MQEPRLFPDFASYCYILRPHGPDDPLNLDNYNNLLPLEKALVAHSVSIRKAEFGDGRWCAHQALKELGRDTGSPILRGDRGMPMWPASVSGSLTHTNGYRGAVVAPRLLVRSLGLDAEPAQPLPPEVVPTITLPSEREFLATVAAELPYADRLIFCAKEATYKAWFPVTHRWLGFEHAEVEIRMDGTFTSHLLIRPTPFAAIEGRWMVSDGFIITSTMVA